ncbi:peptidoglycan recognition family protein [Streptomyces sp. BPPL-273]|uniref:peptidoglycan recognition protein family protein n=1 Tax=Streptomyces sp. BPPL-273 TaxID=2987533 RepID=UPI0024AF9B89|nr:peptidoglycan recognition family protein [Streptomyces sp. BPPL-273]WHM30170.1 peptidoglycan recognition family protein [Streptomyces sp. BPPL-273]
MKLVTRAQLGWPASAAPTQTSTKGVKVHYEGAPVSTKLLSDHNACIAEWKNIRKSHLANTAEGYSDVAYNYAACPHGYLLEGRGLRKRTGANGNQALNQGHYAIVGLVGSEGLTQPTDAMLSAIRDGIDLLRKNGAGSEIKGHRDGYATACPGGPLYAWVQKGAPRPNATTPPKEDDVSLTSAQAKQLTELHKTLVPYAGWAYKGKNEKQDAYAYLRGTKADIAKLATQITGLTAAVNKLAQLAGSGVDTKQVVDAVEKAIADAVVKVDVDITSNQES